MGSADSSPLPCKKWAVLFSGVVTRCHQDVWHRRQKTRKGGGRSEQCPEMQKKHLQSHSLGEERQGLLILGWEAMEMCALGHSAAQHMAWGSPGTIDCAAAPLCSQTQAAHYSCWAVLGETRWMCGV